MLRQTSLICTLSTFLLLTIGTGCNKPERSKSDQVTELMADSTARAIIAQRIVQDRDMYLQVQQLMMQQGPMDTTGGGICDLMMGKARSDSALAEHMCNVMASDTMMAAKMRAKLGLRVQATPMKRGQLQNPSLHDKTGVVRKP
ncbi:MAG: hypothetical protein Q8922_07630 [Bacteroidota bacterium]|nr:hypothetical protein [Bacteroidota bacterium]MDP4233237.1 hypothetical protein [Bacteroidota bacterium]MDP4242144.1 hypothetical protein [Bacteroidota bacterium]MDP4287793.1 hypothetical protein [Bacteroidota bacterium]